MCTLVPRAAISVWMVIAWTALLVHVCSSSSRKDVTQPPPTPRMTQKIYKGLEGNTLWVVCKCRGAQHFKWFFNDGENARRPITSGVHYAKNSRSYLILTDLKHSDQGTYFCRVTSASGSAETSAFVQVEDPEPPPTPKMAQHSYIGLIGGSKALHCSCAGGQRFDWFFISAGKTVQRVRISKGIRTYANSRSTLTLTNLQASDQGTYVCGVNSASGWAETNATLHLHDPLYMADDGDREKTVLEGESVTLSCHGSARGNVTYRWFFGKTEVTQLSFMDSGTSVLHLLRVTHGRHEGVYTCQASSVSQQKSSSKQLKVLVPPNVTLRKQRTLKDQDPFHLVCEAGGSPPPSVTWLYQALHTSFTQVVDEDRSGSRGNRVRSTLSKKHISRTDAGFYVCRASNEAGVAFRRTEVVVEAA